MGGCYSVGVGGWCNVGADRCYMVGVVVSVDMQPCMDGLVTHCISA